MFVACRRHRWRYWPSPAHLVSAPVGDISQRLATLPTAFQALPRPGTMSQLEKKLHSKRSCSSMIFLNQIAMISWYWCLSELTNWPLKFGDSSDFLGNPPSSHHHPSSIIIPSQQPAAPAAQWRGSRSGCERCGEHRERLLPTIREQLGHHFGYQRLDPGEDTPGTAV